jgi:hypothetical protein
LAELSGLSLPEGNLGPIARLLVVEQLVGGQQASTIDDFSLGPNHQGQRRLSLTYTETRIASNVTPEQRTLQGRRDWS